MCMFRAVCLDSLTMNMRQRVIQNECYETMPDHLADVELAPHYKDQDQSQT